MEIKLETSVKKQIWSAARTARIKKEVINSIKLTEDEARSLHDELVAEDAAVADTADEFVALLQSEDNSYTLNDVLIVVDAVS